MNNIQYIQKANEIADKFRIDKSNYYIRWSRKQSSIKKIGIKIPDKMKKHKSLVVYRNVITGQNQFEVPSSDNVIVKEAFLNSSHVSECFYDEIYYDFNYIEELNNLCFVFYIHSRKNAYDIISKDDVNYSDILYVAFINNKKEITICKNESPDDIAFNGKCVVTGTGCDFFISPLTAIYHTSFSINSLSFLSQDDIKYKTEMSKMFPYQIKSGNFYTLIDNFSNFKTYLNQHLLTSKDGPKQDKTTKLCSIKLPKIKLSELKAKENYYYVTIFADKVKKGLAVLRWVRYNNYTKQIIETSRLYISKDDLIFCRRDTTDEFLYTTSKLNPVNFRCQSFIIRDKDCFKETPIKYFSEAMKGKNPHELVYLFEVFLNYPIAEKMWKIDTFSNLITEYLCYHFKTFKNFIEDTRKFGKCNFKAKNPQRALGLNNYQIAACTDNLLNSGDSCSWDMVDIAYIKKLYNTNDISFIDNDLFDKLASIKDGITQRILISLKNIYSLKVATSMANSFVELSNYYKKKSNNTRSGGYFSAISLYGDYLNMVKNLDDTVHFKPYFSSPEDIEELHDAIIPIYNLKEYEVRENEFKQKISKWSKWNYDKNDRFISINPTVPAELATEGISLHHCVKSYIDRVTEGNTNIMFIRKKEEPKKPFFTVEITNDNKIQQVHGFGNRNANTEPGLEDYIKEWAKSCELKLTDINKVR